MKTRRHGVRKFARGTASLHSARAAKASGRTDFSEYVSQAEAAKSGWANAKQTPIEESTTYGAIGVSLEATGLQPDTEYSFRLCAESENSAKTEKLRTIGPEGHFTTLPAPSPSATTDPATNVTATTATLKGTVDPDGFEAAYAFELGVYKGELTSYGIVASGSTGSGSTPVEETLPLTGLQPGTTYAYRIAIKSGYGEAIGATMTFTTAGLPSALTVPSPLAMLPIPPIAFPKPATTPPKCKQGYARNKQGKCVKVKTKNKAKGKKARKSSRRGKGARRGR